MTETIYGLALLLAFIGLAIRMGQWSHYRTLHDANPEHMSEGWMAWHRYGRRSTR